MVKNPPAHAGDVRDMGSIPGSGQFPWRRDVILLVFGCAGSILLRGLSLAVGARS